MRAASSTVSALLVACSTDTFPTTVVIAETSMFAPKASSKASASSIPGSQSMISVTRRSPHRSQERLRALVLGRADNIASRTDLENLAVVKVRHTIGDVPGKTDLMGHHNH